MKTRNLFFALIILTLTSTGCKSTKENEQLQAKPLPHDSNGSYCWDGTLVFKFDSCPIECPAGYKSVSEAPDYIAVCIDSSSELDK